MSRTSSPIASAFSALCTKAREDLMGTDAPQQFSLPGFSLQRELLYMRDAGMSPYEI